MIVLSPPPEARMFPSGLKATTVTISLCPFSGWPIGPLVATSHRMISPWWQSAEASRFPQLPEARVFPSGLKATLQTISVCPVKYACNWGLACAVSRSVPRVWTLSRVLNASTPSNSETAKFLSRKATDCAANSPAREICNCLFASSSFATAVSFWCTASNCAVCARCWFATAVKAFSFARVRWLNANTERKASITSTTPPTVKAVFLVWLSRLRLSKTYCLCKSVGCGSFCPAFANCSSASRRSFPRRSKLLSFRRSHSMARTCNLRCNSTQDRSVLIPASSFFSEASKLSCSRKNIQLSLVSAELTSCGFTSRTTSGIILLLFLTAWSTSWPQTFEVMESGLSRKRNASADSIPFWIWSHQSAVGGISIQSIHELRPISLRAASSFSAKALSLRE